MRLSIVAKEKFGLSRRGAKEAIAERKFIVNGVTATKDADVKDTDNIEYLGFTTEPKFDIADYLLDDFGEVKFLYKPPFMHSDRLRPENELTLSDVVNSLDGYRSLSRLDFETDGIVALVKDSYRVEKVSKEYLAVVVGNIADELSLSWSIDADNRQKVKVNDDYNGNLTYFKLLESNGRYKLISVVLDTASRHQIRAFCEKLSCSILGDKLYGGQEHSRLMLHCFRNKVNDVEATSKKYGDSFFEEFRGLK